MNFWTSRTERLAAIIAKCLEPDRPVSRAQIEAAADRVLRRLQAEPMWESGAPLFDAAAAPKRRPVRRIAAVAAAATLIVLVSRSYWPGADALGRVEAADSSLYALEGEARELLRQGDSIDANEVLRSNGGGGAMLALVDGSRIEMRSQSELSLERADDGVRIRLATGGIIVNAASQQSGHLYVQTKDVTVAVVGTVFVVNVEDDGSRVAVIEGEVRVREGNVDTNLRPGEQVSTSPKVWPVADQIAWSRRAAEHLALLQQAVPQSPAQGDPPASAPPAFDVVSIRQNTSGTGAPATRIEGGRFMASNVPLQQLISDAYRMPVTGGPEWVKSVRGPGSAGQIRFDVIANIPAASPADRIPLMLRTMLAERFQLAVHTETQAREAYALVHAREDRRLGPQLTPSTQQCQVEIEAGALRAPVRRLTEDGKPVCGMMIGPATIRGGGLTLRFLANAMTGFAGRMVVDRTGLEGPFDVELRYAPATARGGGPAPLDDRPSIFVAVQEQLGLKLEPTTAAVDVLVIDRVSMPTEN